MKKPLAMALAATMALTVVMTGCSTTTSSSDSKGGGSGADLVLINGKPEVKKQMEDLAKAYEEETGVKVDVTTIGGNESAADKVKEMNAAGEMPDIFFAEAKDFGDWEGELADLAGEQWTEDTDFEYIDEDGAVLGFPYSVEAHGLAYNADILEKAGVDPASLTGPEAYKTAFETLDSKKDELGLTAVVGYCAEANDLNWSTGTHLFGHYLDAGLKPDDTTYIDMLNDGGKLDEERFTAYGEFVGMLNQYSDPALLVDGTYDKQVLGFASGKYAFVTQGSWIGATLTGDDADQYEEAGSFKCGFAPVAFEDGIGTIMNAAPNFWTVYDGDNVDKAKEFLQWASEDDAQKILVEDAGFVSPYSDCSYESADPFAAAVTEWMAEGKHSSYHTMQKKSGLEAKTGTVYQDYAKGDIKDAKGFYEAMEETCESYYAE